MLVLYLSYLLVYVGVVSILILFLFILMLINVRISELLSNTSNSIPLAILIAISFNYPVYQILPYSIASSNSDTLYLNNTLNNMWSNMHIVLCLGSMARSTLVRAFFLSTKQNYKYFLVRAFVSLSFVSLSLVSRSFVSLSLHKCDMISLYSSMVERNTVNIMIDVQFILRAIKSCY